jgi:hypothetical protein
LKQISLEWENAHRLGANGQQYYVLIPKTAANLTRFAKSREPPTAEPLSRVSVKNYVQLWVGKYVIFCRLHLNLEHFFHTQKQFLKL